MSRTNPRQSSHAALLGTISYLAMILLCPRPVGAEVVTDGTMGRRGTVPGGLDVTVGAKLGQQRGGNLFHSFEKFDVETGGKVTFTGPDSVRNVIGRVTGGNPSAIDGTLASSIPGADLYLLNPAGIVFGPNARLDVKGAFHASTASELRFSDGTVFSALDSAGSTLSVAEPQSFGFLGAAPGRITVDQGILAVPAGRHLSLSAGEVDLSGGVLLAGDQTPGDGLLDPGGRITLVGLAEGQLELTSGSTAGVDVGGRVSLRGQARLDASGNGGGRVRIRAEDLEIREESSVFAHNLGDFDGQAGIELAVGRVTLTGGSLVAADALGAGRAGSIAVGAETAVALADASHIRSDGFGVGRAGSVTLVGGALELTGGSRITASSHAGGDAGTIDITMRDRVQADNGGIASAAEDGSTGLGGSVALTSGALQLVNGAVVETSGNGGGSVRISAEDISLAGRASILASTLGDADAVAGVDLTGGRLQLDGESLIAADVGRARIVLADGTTVPGTAAGGNGGTVTTTMREDVTILDGSRLRSATYGPGNAGRVQVSARGLHIDGTGFDRVTGILGVAGVDPGRAIPPGKAEITGAAGSVEVKVQDLLLQGGGSIGASTFTTGSTGRIDIEVDHLLKIDGAGAQARQGQARPTQISASSGRNAPGGPGMIRVVAGELEIVNNGTQPAEIRGSTSGSSPGTPVYVHAGNLTIDGRNTVGLGTPDSPFTGIVSATRPGSTGDAGAITVVADGSLVLRNGGEINGLTEAAGRASSISIVARDLTIEGLGATAKRRTQIISNTGGKGVSGDGGTIDLRVGNRLELKNAGAIVTSTRESGTGDAGAILVRANEILMTDGSSIAASTGTSGAANSVTVEAARLLTLLGIDTRISGNARSSGDAGEVVVRAGSIDLRNGGAITSDTSGAGDAGNVTVASPLIVLSSGSISSSAAAGSRGKAGTVQLTTTNATAAAGPWGGLSGSVRLSNGAAVTTSTGGTGAAGAVAIRTGSLSVRGQGTKVASDTSTGGNAGAIRIVANDVVVGPRGQISSMTSGQGKDAGTGGTVTIKAHRNLRVDGGRVTSSSTGGGAGGDILIEAPRALVLLKGVDAPNATGRRKGAGEITAAASGGGKAGRIEVTARDLMATNGSIRTSSADAEGGKIEVRAMDRLFLRGSEIAADGRVAREGTAVMTIRASQIVLSNGQMTSLTQNQVAAGSGEVRVNGDDFTVVSANSTIRGSTKTLISGLQTNLGSDLQLSPGIFLDTNRLLQPSCADRGAARSTFTRSGRGGLPPAPDRPLPSAGVEAAGVGRVAVDGTVFLDDCTGSLIPETKS